MTPTRTTLVFVILAMVSLGLAWWSKPEAIITESDVTEDRVGQDVFPDFTDPNLATSLEIVRYDETLAQLNRFVVAKDRETGLWKLPSHDGYPADAAEQVRDATTPLIGLRILSIASTNRGDHELYGVINPEDSSVASGSSGVGMLVRLKDDNSKVLAALIIGKQVEGTTNQRYVRIPTEDVVYTVEIDTRAFTTEFTDWIQEQLLGIRSFDITRVGVHDYDLVQQSESAVKLTRNFDAMLAYDPAENRWSLIDYRQYRGGAALPAEMEPNEQLNTKFLNDLRLAAQDLTIVNVKRKPAALAAALRNQDSGIENQQNASNLQQFGFFPAQTPEGLKVFALGGETIIGTADGVRYLLQFGKATANLASIGQGSGNDAEALSRFLMVTATLDESQFPIPDLEVVPETVEQLLERDKRLAGGKAPETNETPEELRERLEIVQEEIRKENQRKIDERNEQIEAARRRVAELNARFSDWYYVISDSDYQKLKINREKLFVKSTGPTAPTPQATDTQQESDEKTTEEQSGLIPSELASPPQVEESSQRTSTDDQ